jgi:hypothetical protein
MFIDMRGGCEDMQPHTWDLADECEAAVLSEALPEGMWAVFVAPSDWLLEYECGVEYELTIEGYSEHCNPVPVEARSWGAVKALYR